MLEAIKSLIRPERVARLNLDSLVGSNIEYTLTLTYNRKTTSHGQGLMNALGTAFRDVDDLDTTLKLVGGDKIKGSDLKVTGPVKIETFDGVPATAAVFESMRAWLLERVGSQDVVDR